MTTSSKGWGPDGKRAAVCVTFDNLGEVCELGLGLWPTDLPLGSHPSVTKELPQILDLLDAAGLKTTFFFEGWGAEIYPEAVASVIARGHEQGCHGWKHEPTGSLPPAEALDAAGRGIAALRAQGVDVRGFRPPGGRIGPLDPAALRDLGISYCAPAGTAPGTVDGMPYLPWLWTAVDALFYFGPFQPLRKGLGLPDDPPGHEAFQEAIDRDVERTIEEGGLLIYVMHAFLLTEPERMRTVERLLQRVAADNRLWMAPLSEVAAFVRADPDRFEGSAQVETASWF